MLLSHGFADHVRHQDFTSWVFENSPEEWRAMVDALREVGAIGYAEVLARFIAVDGGWFSAAGSEPPGTPDRSYAEDYDQSLARFRKGGDGETDPIERQLLDYAVAKGLA